MTLRRQLAYLIAGMILALILLAGASIWGVVGLHQDFGAAIRGYADLREVYEVGSHIATAQTLLRLPPGESRDGLRAALREVRIAASRAELLRAGGDDPGLVAMQQSLVDAQAQLVELVAATQPSAPTMALSMSLNDAMAQVAHQAARIRQDLQRVQDAAAGKRRATITTMGAVAGLLVLGAIVAGTALYASVMRPLSRLSSAARRFARGELARRVPESGHAEFAALAADFNQMAGELDGLYRDLERKVEQKSRELARSERLASVGFLAAGVAHEINNPIGIIAGYAEFSQEQLKQPGPEALAEARRTLAVIAEEAFRCKQIVQKLLSLAHPGDESRQRISLADVASNVVSTLRGLERHRGRTLKLDVPAGANCTVIASEAEMKQVVLNLALNALEAIDGEGGEVRVSVAREERVVRLSVEDTGRGMTSEVLERVFEPFYTARRGASRPGTGLGLSITNAIVQSHGGRITAHSAGPGRGSRFDVELPAAEGGAA